MKTISLFSLVSAALLLSSVLNVTGEASEEVPWATEVKVGGRLQAWTLATDDTQLTVGVSTDHKLCVFELSSRETGWNWTARPSALPLLERADMAGVQYEPDWAFQQGTVDHSDGTKVTIRFTSRQPALELTSVWHARSGPGPIRHTMFIQNRTEQPVTISEQPDWIPFVAIDADGTHGLYLGWEWSIGRITMAGDSAVGGAFVQAGNHGDFRTDLAPGQTFEVPPGFVGAYTGDLDDAANRLHKYLLQHGMPAILRDDPSYPKVEWNAFAATGKQQGSWDSVEAKYYPLIDAIAPLGFEEIVLDVGWWQGDTTHQPHPPMGDTVDWSSGIRAARDYAHQNGLRFGLYWNCNPPMTTLAGMQHRKDDARALYEKFGIDFFRSDGTDGNVLQTGGHGPGTRAAHAEEIGYWQTKGYYEVLDDLYAEIPNFALESCSGGGRIKDYGISKRSIKMQNQDRYYPLDARQSFYDASYALHPMQLAALTGSWIEWQASGSVYEFRSSAMGAADWHPDAPGGGNGGPAWSAEQKAAIQKAVTTFVTKLRPLIRNADLYHIFPRPDGKHWDGIEYYDPATKKGVVYLFKPAAEPDTMTVRLRGLRPEAHYRVRFEDGSNPTVEQRGDALTAGIEITVAGQHVSELMFFEEFTPTAPIQSTRE